MESDFRMENVQSASGDHTMHLPAQREQPDLEHVKTYWTTISATGIGSSIPLLVRGHIFNQFLYYSYICLQIGKTLLHRYKSAVSDRNLQKEAHRGISASFEDKVLKVWTSMCIAWEADGFPKSAPNPFHVTETGKYFCLRLMEY